MKSMIILAAFMFLASNALAANSVRCSSMLQEPLPDDGSMGLFMPPAQKILVFDYILGSEKNVYLKSKLLFAPVMNDPHPLSQYSLELASSPEEASMIISFSASALDGGRFSSPENFGLYVYTLAEGKKDGLFQVANASGTGASRMMQLSSVLTGYIVLTCVSLK